MVEILARATADQKYDDFAMDKQDNAFVAVHPNNVVKVLKNGTIHDVTNGIDVLTQPASVALGNGRHGRSLYVVTEGNLTAGGDVNGQILEVNIEN